MNVSLVAVAWFCPFCDTANEDPTTSFCAWCQCERITEESCVWESVRPSNQGTEYTLVHNYKGRQRIIVLFQAQGTAPFKTWFYTSEYGHHENWQTLQKSCYDSAHICPIRAEISTYEHWENVFILLFVWLVVMGFRQNYFHISPNFGDFGAKMSFFRYIINQKRKISIKHCSPRVPKHHLYQRCVSI